MPADRAGSDALTLERLHGLAEYGLTGDSRRLADPCAIPERARVARTADARDRHGDQGEREENPSHVTSPV